MDLPVPLEAAVIEAEVKPSKGGPYWFMVLRTKVGDIRSVMFACPEEPAKSPLYPHLGQIVSITNYVNEMEARGNIKVNEGGFTVMAQEDLKDDDFIKGPKAAPEDIKWAIDLITDKTDWDDTGHYKFTIACLKEFGIDKIKECPAGTHVHHSYRGGMLVHSAEVLSYCKAMLATRHSNYDFLTKDVIMSAAILHDLGKLTTYFFDDLGVAQQMLTEQTVGHFIYGGNVLLAVAAKTKGLDSQFVDEVLHCVMAHHAKREWGSVVEPQTIEADMLAKADYLSSRDGAMRDELMKYKRFGKSLPDKFYVYKTPYVLTDGIRRFMKR